MLSTGFDDGVVPILYTWPSRNTLAGYPADENEVERSAKYFADLLFWLRSGIPEAEIEIVAGYWIYHNRDDSIFFGTEQRDYFGWFPYEIAGWPRCQTADVIASTVP